MKRKKLTIQRVLLILLLLGVVSTIVTYFFVGNRLFTDFLNYAHGIVYGFLVGLTFWLGNFSLGRFTGRQLNWEKNPQRANTISMLSFILFGIVASVSVPLIYYGYFHRYQEHLLRTVVINGFINLAVDVIFVSFYYSKYLVHYYAASLKKEEELKRENLIAKYEALKNQVNPHFLFNSLNTLTGVVEQNPEKAVGFIKKLSDIYRYVLEQQDKELVSFDEEMKFVNDYFDLAQIRHGKALSMSVQFIDTNIYLAPLALQMLVENAIKHNVVSDDHPLLIEIGVAGKSIYVRNNIQKKNVMQKNGVMGLENLKNRYLYLSDKPVEVLESDTEFMVKLPVIENIQP